MNASRVDSLGSLRAHPVFSLVVLVALAIIGFFGVVVLAGLLGLSGSARAMGHFSTLDHRIHDLSFGFLFGTAAVGLLAQLVGPSRNVAGLLMALMPWIALLLMVPLANYAAAPGAGFVIAASAFLGALTLNAAIFHPIGRLVVRSFSAARVDRPMLALVAVAAVPLLAYAFENLALQRIVTEDHAAMGHYGFMAALSFTVIGVGVLASLRPEGWRLAAWVAGSLPALLGLASLVFPVSSSLEPLWAIAAVAWGVVFVALAERARSSRTS